jgi:hypothetical protein
LGIVRDSNKKKIKKQQNVTKCYTGPRKEDEMGRLWMGKMRNVYKIFVGNTENMKPLGRHRRRSVDNIRLHLREKGLEVVDWIHQVQDRKQWRAFENTVLNLLFPQRRGIY